MPRRGQLENGLADITSQRLQSIISEIMLISGAQICMAKRKSKIIQTNYDDISGTQLSRN